MGHVLQYGRLMASSVPAPPTLPAGQPDALVGPGSTPLPCSAGTGEVSKPARFVAAYRLVIGRFIESKIGRWARRTVLSDSEPPTPAELARSNQYASERTAAFIPGLCFITIGLLSFWSLFDSGMGLDPPVAAAYVKLRLGASVVVGTLGLIYLALHRLKSYGRLCLAILTACGISTVGWSMSELPPTLPYIHTTSWLVLGTLMVIVPFGYRLLVAAATSGGMWLAYVIPQWHVVGTPEHGIFLSNLVGITIVAIVFGQLLYLLLLDLFVARQRLQTLKQGLESRIELATAEMRALTSRIDTVRQEERRWMAHAVHDELGQELTAMRYTLALGQDQVRQSNEAAPATLDDLEMLLDRTNATMRRIIRRLRPVALDELGFVGALRWLGRDLGKRVGCRVTVTMGPTDFEPPRGVAEMLFRAAKEGLNNVAKHAEAANVLIGVDQTEPDASGESVISLTIEDDGAGFSEHAAEAFSGPDSGLGLAGIRERARRLQGIAAWSTSALGGVKLHIAVPVRPEPSLAEEAGAVDSANLEGV